MLPNWNNVSTRGQQVISARSRHAANTDSCITCGWVLIPQALCVVGQAMINESHIYVFFLLQDVVSGGSEGTCV